MGEGTNSRIHFYGSVIAASLNGIAVGNLAGWPQSAIPQLLSPEKYSPAFTESEVAWIAGIFFLGMLVGGFTSLVISARFGKRKLFLLACVPLIVGWCVIALAATFWHFILGRIVLGLGGGMMCHQTEMYLSEISPPQIRSSMSIGFCACVHIGVLLSFAIGPSLTLTSATSFYLTVIFMLAGIYLTVAPETPFWLLRQAKPDDALQSLRLLRGKQDVNEEFQGIVQFMERSVFIEKNEGLLRGAGRVFGDKASRKAILLVVLLTTAQQFSGMAAMHSYAQLIFERSVSIIPGRYVSLLIGLIELCCTLATGFLVERLGRRPLVAVSCLFCSGCMALLGLHFHTSATDASFSALPLVCIVVFAFAYGLGLSTMATVVAAECLAMDARNLGAAAQNTTVCFSIFFITKIWQVISTSYGQQYSFWTAAVVTAVHAVLLLAMLPETRGRSLTEIQSLLASSASTTSSTASPSLSKKINIVPARDPENGTHHLIRR